MGTRSRRRRGHLAVLGLAAVLLAAAGADAPPRPLPPAGAIEVVGLGDSVVAGAACGCEPLTERYGDLLAEETGRPVHVDDLGVGGLTAPGLLARLQAGTDDAQAVARSDVAVVVVGANDLAPLLGQWRAGGCDLRCEQPALAAMGRSVRAVLDRVDGLRDGHPGVTVVTTYWNVFVDGRVARRTLGPAYLSWSDDLTRRADARICAAAAAAGARCADLYTPFKGPDGDRDPSPLLADDGDHPSAAGHRLIAQVLRDLAPLRACAAGSGAPSGQSPC